MHVLLIDTPHAVAAIVESFEAVEVTKVQQIKQVTLHMALYAGLTAQEMVSTHNVPSQAGPVKRRGKGKNKRW